MLNNENYFSIENQMKYMGVSQFKSFEECQASALAEVTGNYQREQTASLLVGSYVDAHFEGTLDIFKAKNPEIFTKKGDLKADYRKANVISPCLNPIKSASLLYIDRFKVFHTL